MPFKIVISKTLLEKLAELEASWVEKMQCPKCKKSDMVIHTQEGYICDRCKLMFCSNGQILYDVPKARVLMWLTSAILFVLGGILSIHYKSCIGIIFIFAALATPPLLWLILDKTSPIHR